MGKRPRTSSRLYTVASFAAGVLLAGLFNRKTCDFKGDARPAAVCDEKQNAAEQSGQDVLYAISSKELSEQLDFCKNNQSSVQQLKLKTSGFSYVRRDIQPGLGAAGYNMSMWVYDGRTDIVSNSILDSGIWESHETKEIMNQLASFEQSYHRSRHEMFFIDIGANIGWFTMNAAAMGYSVIAFEPITPNAYAIRHTLCGFPLLQQHVALVTKGLSDRPEVCRVTASDDNVGDGQVNCNTDPASDPPPGKIVHCQFELITLDSYFKHSLAILKDRVALVKVDVEGFEDKVFKGAKLFMEIVKPKFVLCEFHAKFSQGTTAEEMLRMFHEWGYVAHTGRFDSPVETSGGFGTWAERNSADKDLVNVYFIRS